MTSEPQTGWGMTTVHYRKLFWGLRWITGKYEKDQWVGDKHLFLRLCWKRPGKENDTWDRTIKPE